jgi:uncharacterized protein YndB with AHSA1/START domain
MIAYAQPLGCNLEHAMTTVRREIVLPVERERAWELLTEAAELEGWLADEVAFEPEEGAPLRASWESGEERAGVVEEVDPERRIRFVWTGADDASEVEWVLADAVAGTRLLVVERRLATYGPVAVADWAPRMEMLARAATLVLA